MRLIEVCVRFMWLENILLRYVVGLLRSVRCNVLTLVVGGRLLFSQDVVPLYLFVSILRRFQPHILFSGISFYEKLIILFRVSFCILLCISRVVMMSGRVDELKKKRQTNYFAAEILRVFCCCVFEEGCVVVIQSSHVENSIKIILKSRVVL